MLLGPSIRQGKCLSIQDQINNMCYLDQVLDSVLLATLNWFKFQSFIILSTAYKLKKPSCEAEFWHEGIMVYPLDIYIKDNLSTKKW